MQTAKAFQWKGLYLYAKLDVQQHPIQPESGLHYKCGKTTMPGKLMKKWQGKEKKSRRIKKNTEETVVRKSYRNK